MKINNSSVKDSYNLRKSERIRLFLSLIILLLLSIITIIFTVTIIVLIGDLNILIIFGSVLMFLFAFLLLFYSGKYYLDLKNNDVEIYEGIVENKTSSGIDYPIFTIKIGSAFHHVSPGQYFKVNAGDHILLRKAPVSKRVLAIKKIQSKDG